MLQLYNPTFLYVLAGTVLLAGAAAVVGCFTFLRKRALVGDALAHSVLPGVCLAFLVSGQKSPVVLLIGAFASGWLSLLFIDWITRRTKIKEDAAIGIVLSVFFGAGILLLTTIQHGSNAAQSGLDKFLFGQAASLVGEDVAVFSVVNALVLGTVWVFFKEFTLLSFDHTFATSIGLPVRRLDALLTSLTVLVVVTGIQAVGVVLMAAMLITPAAAARYWTDNLRVMVTLAAGLAGIAALAGATLSYLAPGMPTGPWMVMVISMLAVGSFVLAPGKGILAKWRRQKQNRQLMLEENILKAFFQIGEKSGTPYHPQTTGQLQAHRFMPNAVLLQGLAGLQKEGYLSRSGTGWTLTDEGRKRGKRVTRLHRLWELYLSQVVHIAPDHVHDDAESMEHVLTPELEARILEQLGNPEYDPHQSRIPK